MACLRGDEKIGFLHVYIFERFEYIRAVYIVAHLQFARVSLDKGKKGACNENGACARVRVVFSARRVRDLSVTSRAFELPGCRARTGIKARELDSLNELAVKWC